jgi:hypothetical protein
VLKKTGKVNFIGKHGKKPMKIITPILIAGATAGLTLFGTLFAVNKHIAPCINANALKQLAMTSTTVDRSVKNISDRLRDQLTGFCTTVAEDRDFAMKLIVEQDASAPEVSEIAARYIGAMGFSFLDIIDANATILSSGHFPAYAGSRNEKKKTMRDSVATVMVENSKGTDVLTLQVRIPFTCAGTILSAIGGIVIDSSFVATLIPYDGVLVVIKKGNTVTGMPSVESMSELKDNHLIINNQSWLAAQLPLPWSGETEQPALIVLLEEPVAMTILDFF